MTSWIQVLPGGGTVEVNPYYQSPVENATVVTPPEDAAVGARYLLVNTPSSATAFTGYQYHIAVRTPLGWDFVAPLEGMQIYDKSLDKTWTYSLPGYWILGSTSAPSFSSLSGVPTDNVALAAALNAKSATGHVHTGVYATVAHDHAADYAALGHDHDSDYSDIAHNHNADYATVGHTHSDATVSASGFMSAADKTKLDSLETYGATTHAGYALSTNQTITTGTSAAVTFDTEIVDPEEAFSISSSQVVLRIGKAYLVNWTLSGYGDTANTKSKVSVALQQGPTSWTTVANSTVTFQTPDSANADNQVFTQSGYGILTTTSGDDRNIRLYVTPEASWGGIVIDKDKSRIDVIELTAWGGGGGGAGVWGFITGDIANQADLAAAYAALAHSHADATTSVAGFLSATDKTKLDGIEPAAEANPTGEEIANALDTYLGGSSWRTGSGGGGDLLQASYYNAAQSSQIAAGSTGNFNFDTAGYTRSGVSYTLSGGELTINDTGTFYFLAQAAVVSDTANTKAIVTTTLQTDNSGTWAAMNGATAVLPVMHTTATTAYQISHITVFGTATFAASGKKVRILLAPLSGWAPIKTALGGWIQIWKQSTGSGGGDGTPGGTDRTVQFNNAGTFGGAAGVSVRSPTVGIPGYTNHLLHANTYTCGYFQDTVASGGSFWCDSAHDMAYELTLNGSTTLKGSSINVANNNELSALKVYLKNNTVSALQVAVDVSSGQFNEVINLTNPFSIAANSTRVVYLVARKNNSGVLTRSVEG